MSNYQDYIVRASAADGQIRVFAATTRELVEKDRTIHNTSPVATAALGRLLTGAAMMGSMMKGRGDVLTVQIMGDGPIGNMTVTADSMARVKGIVQNPGVMLPASKEGKLDVGGAVGMGMFRVIKDLGLKEPYIGEIELISGEIAEDFTYYFAASEQVPSSVALGVLMNRDNTVAQAGGFIIQLMPNATEEVISHLEQKLTEVTAVSGLLEEGMTPEEILEYIFAGFDLKLLDKIPTCYYCNCSKERVEKALISVGRSELEAMIADGEPITTNCQFCDSHYTFSVEELKTLAENAVRK
ncbi:MAG: Hsp33 family molecular chaperone HslO [Lachnospiraceae bacterium]|nr:Hsp33 family molecular chaperone HslO [Lachnospiraceae bacterium]